MPTLSDTLLEVRAAQQGDRAALEALFTRYRPRVLQIVALRLGRSMHDCADIEDLAQEALLKAFRAFDRFDLERSEGTFRNWLARIVENAIRDAGRRRQAQKRGGVGACQPDAGAVETVITRDPRPSQAAQGKELEERIDRVLLRMPETQRELVLLRDRCGMSYGEVAETLGLRNADVARAMHHRALRALAAALEGAR